MSDAARAFTGSVAELYDRCLGPTIFEAFARELAGRFAGFRGRLLETAAGTGRVTRALAAAADPAAEIVATDLNAPMLQRAAALGTPPNVQWREADAQALPFEDAAFDAMACQFGVMFYPDKAAGYREARRVLKPGGRYVFSVWDRLDANPLSQVAHDALAALYPDDPPSFLARGPSGHADEAAIHQGLAAAGFAEVTVERVTLPTPAASAAGAALGLCGGTPLRAEIEPRGEGELDRAVAAVTEALTAAFGPAPFAPQGRAIVTTAIRPA